MTADYRQRSEELKKSIIEYSQRTLTYESDALNAFRGILTRSGLLTFYGHPVCVKGSPAKARYDRRGFTRSLLWPALVNGRTRETEYYSIFEYLKDLDRCLADLKVVDARKRSIPTWSWAASRPISNAWTWESSELEDSDFESRYCSFPTAYSLDRVTDPGTRGWRMQETELTEIAAQCAEGMIPENSSRLIFQDAVLLTDLDIFKVADSMHDQFFRARTSRPPQFEGLKFYDMGLDPSAEREILEILADKACLYALLIDANSAEPTTIYEDKSPEYYQYLEHDNPNKTRSSSNESSSSDNLRSYFHGEAILEFLLVHRKGDHQLYRRVGRLSGKLLDSNSCDSPISFTRERIELM